MGQSALLGRDRIRHAANMLRLNKQEDTLNDHLSDDSDLLTREAFKNLYSEQLLETKPSGEHLRG
jgi:hypothetical protein